MRLGIDVGGTFTDLAALGADGRITTAKALSVASDRAAGVLHVVAAGDIDAARVDAVAHGTTVVTNLLLERRGARTVLCATAGFTDVLDLRRQDRAGLYDLTRHHAPPLVDATMRVDVRERVVPDEVREALDDDTIARVVALVREKRPETVAIALLHAYQHPDHERRLRDALDLALNAHEPQLQSRRVFQSESQRESHRQSSQGSTHGSSHEGGDVSDSPTTPAASHEARERIEVVTSHETLPEIREYERTATTVAEAYSRPAVRGYLASLAGRLASLGLPAPHVMTSSGGTVPSDVAATSSASLALSGPAGGVTGAAAYARALGIRDALTIDIGGTSADVGLVVHGEPLVERGGDVAGVPIALPRVLVEAVAAGGGSIGWIDDGGALRAGPESAGADPGPASYGRGGNRPTVTDAHAVLGHLSSQGWSGGVALDIESARRVMGELASRLGVSVERAATALIATADATMARALRRVSVERGIDPREVPLIAFGGGGPLHACGLAEQLGTRTVIVPPFAGVLSAVGLALAPLRREGLASLVRPVRELEVDVLNGVLDREARRLATDGASSPKWWLRLRYEGQGHELEISVERNMTPTEIAGRFAAAHLARTGFMLDRPVECISVRTALSGDAHLVRFERRPTAASRRLSDPSPAAKATRSESPPAFPLDASASAGATPTLFDDGDVLERTVRGPAVITLRDATVHVARGWTARALPTGGWIVEVDS